MSWVYIAGHKARIISQNYQTGETVIEFDSTVPLGYSAVHSFAPGELDKVRDPDLASGYWGPSSTPTKKCTCGVAHVSGGKHSDWCDLYDKWENS